MRFGLVLLALILAPPAVADTFDGPVPAEVVEVIDGDTVRVRARIWIDQEISVKVRLARIDAPELRTAKCEAERERAGRARAAAMAIAGDTLVLRDIRHGKYAGRVVAEAYTEEGVSLSDALVAQGHAVETGEPESWCAAG